MKKFFANNPSTILLLCFVTAALVLNMIASQWLNNSYAASEFPVPYFEAQLSFSAEKIKHWYGILIEKDTLGVYINTQHIDFIFIFSVLLLHFFVLVLISRFFPEHSKGRNILIICAILSTIAPIADALENLVSYIMLANPTGFADWLVYPYSGFAAIKFAMFTFAYIAAAVGILVGVFMRLSILFKNNSKLEHA